MGLIFIKLSRNVTNLCLIKLNILLKGDSKKLSVQSKIRDAFFLERTEAGPCRGYEGRLSMHSARGGIQALPLDGQRGRRQHLLSTPRPIHCAE